MKKISNYFGLAAMLLSLVSCQEFKETFIVGRTINVSFATSVDDSQTKVSLERNEHSNFVTDWCDGDKITVKYGNHSAEATWNIEKEVFDAELDPSAQTTDYTYQAIYPVLDNNCIAFGSERSQIGNGFNGAYDVMLSKPVTTTVEEGGTVHFEMKRQTAIQYFKFISKGLGDIASEKVDSATLTLTGDNANIAGSFNWDGGVLSADANSKTIKISFDSQTAPTADSVVLWFNVIPVEYESMSLDLATRHHKIRITNNKPGSFVAGKLYKTELDLSAEAFISKWEEIPPKTFVENFSSKNATNNNYDCGSELSTADNRKDFDYVWNYGGSGTVFKNGIKLGAKSSTGSVTNSTILESIESGSNFTVKVYAAVWNNDGGKVSVTYNDKEVTLSAANDAITSTSSEYKAADFAKATSFVFNKAKDVNEFTVASSSKRILIDKIEVVEGGELPEPFSVSTESLTPKWDDTEATFDIVAGDKVNWEIVADEGLTLSQDSGTGNATITVTFDQNTAEEQVEKTILVSTDYPSLEGESEYEISFIQAGKPSKEMDGDGTVENPYSVADALYLIGKLSDNGTSASEVYVKGTIVGDDAGIDTKYGNATFDIIDSGKSDDTLNVFRVKDLSATAEGASFTATDQLSVGDEVVVFAKLKKYVTDSKVTPETNEGKLYSINGKTYILTGIAVSGQTTSFAQNTPWEFGGTVTASFRGKADTNVTSSASFKVNGAAPSTATLGNSFEVTVSYTDGDIEKTAAYTYSVYDPDAVRLEKVESVDDFTAGMYVIMSYDEAFYVPNAEASSAAPPVMNVSKIDNAITVTPDMVWNATAGSTQNTWKFESFSIKNYFLTGSSSSNGVKVKTSPGTAGDWQMVLSATYGVIGTAIGSGSRYLSTYGTQDWRNYTEGSLSSSNKAANFFKLLNWSLPKHTLTITAPTNGTITAKVGGEAVNSGDKIEEGATVTITATPSDKYIFSGWTVEGATVEDASEATTTFVVGQKDISVSAAFVSADIEYDVTVASGITGGSITVNPSKAKAGQTVEITSTPTGTNVLLSLAVTGNTSGQEVTVTDNKFTMPAEAVTVSATFGKEVKTIVITASSVTNFTNEYKEYSWTQGGVSGTMYAYRGGSSGSYNMQFNKSTQIHNTSAVPGRIKSITMTKVSSGTTRSWSVYVGASALSSTTGATIVDKAKDVETETKWSVESGDYYYFYITKADGGTNIGSITIEYEPGDVPEPTKYKVNIANGITGGTVSASAESATAGTEITLTATPAEGYTFGSWDVKDSLGEAIKVEDNKFTMPASNVTVSATFNKTSQGGGTDSKDYTYIFTSKSWEATLNGEPANWTCGKEGAQLTSNQGIQVTKSNSGAKGTSDVSYTNVSKVVVKYCTNASNGVGTIKVQVGSGTEQSFSVAKPSSNGTTLKDAEFTFSPNETGKIMITAECTTNSVYIYGVTITAQ